MIVLHSEDHEIVLRQFTFEDVPEIFALIDRNREHLSQFGDNTALKYPTEESVRQSIDSHSKKRLRFGIRNKGEELVGSINIQPDFANPRIAEIGYYLGREYTGRGYMNRAVAALTRYAFDELSYEQVYGKVAHQNTASASVLLKAGYVQTGKTKKDIIYSCLARKNR